MFRRRYVRHAKPQAGAAVVEFVAMANVLLDTLPDEMLCQKCGYDLRGLADNRCPECGEMFDPRAALIARIPWLRRKVIGAWRAYWQTVRMVLFTPTKLAHELWNAPRLDPPAAMRFRRTVIAQALFTAIIVTGILTWGNASRLIVQMKWLTTSEMTVVVSLGALL